MASNIRVSKDDEGALSHISDLLHLFLHRNKNQHRRSLWWRHFQVFRKQTNLYLSEVQDLNRIPSTHLERTRKKARDDKITLRVRQRLAYWQDITVPKWHHAFSQLCADGRFAMLGLTLIAALAEVCRIAGVTAGLEEVGHVEVEKVLARFAREGWEDSDAVDHDSSGIREDKGEVISRHHEVPVGDEPSETVVKETASPAEDTTSNLQPPRTAYKRHPTADTARATKKKRKKGNAIDDLFGGLD